jgi:hypothetical protein
MTKTKIEHPDLLEIAAMRARWKEERAAGAPGETFALFFLQQAMRAACSAARQGRVRFFER